MSSTRVILDPKRASEKVNITFDFTSRMSASAGINTAVVTASVWSGVDANPSAIVNGAATLLSPQVIQSIQGGLAGVIYLLKCQVTTQAEAPSQTLVLEALLTILPEGI